MNPGRILEAFAQREVDCLLIGGMNFFLRHRPVTTFDVDFWIQDEDRNLERVIAALADLQAEGEQTDGTWGPVSAVAWLRRQSVFCLTSPSGAIDLFRFVQGLESYEECRTRSMKAVTNEGIAYRSLSDGDMLRCQLALPEGFRRLDRVAYFEGLLSP